MPPESELLPPMKAIFSTTSTSAPASLAESAAESPAKPEPTTRTSCISSNFAGIGSLQAASAVNAVAPVSMPAAAAPRNLRRLAVMVMVFSFFRKTDDDEWAYVPMGDARSD